jgi:hypothetical protein
MLDLLYIQKGTYFFKFERRNLMPRGARLDAPAMFLCSGCKRGVLPSLRRGVARTQG